MEKQESRVLVIEIYAGEQMVHGRFNTRGVDDIPLFIKACTKFVMTEMRRQGLRPDKMRTYYDR